MKREEEEAAAAEEAEEIVRDSFFVGLVVGGNDRALRSIRIRCFASR